jgi:hypothetical protein
LRPLIRINDKYYWAPHSTRKSASIWLRNLSLGTLPADLESPKIQEEIEQEKKFIDKALENKGYDIVARFTPYVIKNCRLHDRDSAGGHPEDLGDYDVLAFYKEKNTILNIECKDILPPFCLKDATRLKRKIFGEDMADEGHFKQINKRLNYLLENIERIADGLKWPIDPSNLPRVVTIYLTRETYWWTRFPPRDTNVIFLQSNQLMSFIIDL